MTKSDPQSAILLCRSSVSNTQHTEWGVVLCTPTYAEAKPTSATLNLNMVNLLIVTTQRNGLILFNAHHHHHH